MLSIVQVKGAIFDVDETLLDTGGGRHSDARYALHEQARQQAIQEAGERHGISQLVSLTPEENLQGFLEAPVHSLEGAVWHIMYMKGVVTTDEVEPANPLLREMVARKDELFEALLRSSGKPIAGAVAFVHWLAANGLQDRLAVASTAIRRDIDIFLEMTGLHEQFPSERIISKQDVTHVKPNPEAFDKAFLALGLPENARSHVLAFEDNPRGIMSAKAAGLFTCGITVVLPREELLALEVAPDLVADSFGEFRELLS